MNGKLLSELRDSVTGLFNPTFLFIFNHNNIDAPCEAASASLFTVAGAFALSV